MKRVLITAVGGDIAQSIIECLKDYKNNLFLIGCDIHKKHGGSQLVDKFFIVPSADSKNYLNKITDLIKTEKIERKNQANTCRGGAL